MLRTLSLFLFLLIGGAVGLRWVRRRVGGGSGGWSSPRITRDELRELTRQARRSSPLERALGLRAKITEALEGRRDRADLGRRVDEAIRRLASQARLRGRITEALESRGSVPAHDVDEEVSAFEERQVSLQRLAGKAEELDRSLEQGVLELSNLHLALLELSAAEAIEVSGALDEALGELESAGERARQDREAEAEVARFLAARTRVRNR